MSGTTVTWNSDTQANNYRNTGAGYVTKTDNGFYLVKFTYNGDLKVVAVRSALEILSEAPKALAPIQASTDISLMYTHLTAFLTANASDASTNPIPDEPA